MSLRNCVFYAGLSNEYPQTEGFIREIEIDMFNI